MVVFACQQMPLMSDILTLYACLTNAVMNNDHLFTSIIFVMRGIKKCLTIIYRHVKFQGIPIGYIPRL